MYHFGDSRRKAKMTRAEETNRVSLLIGSKYEAYGEKVDVSVQVV